MNLFKQVRFALPFILFLFIVILLMRGLSLHPNQIPSPLMNKPAPTFSNDFKGHVTLLNVWATWCSACAEEHDFLLQLAREKEVILMGLNYKDNPKAAIRWLKQQGNPYQLVAYDPTGQIGIDWGVYGTPETFIIDKKGIIRYKQLGPLTQEVWEQTLKPLIQQLQNESL